MGRIEARFGPGGSATARYRVEPDPSRLGDFEYVFVVRAPDQGVSARSQNRLEVAVEGDRLRIDVQIDPDAPRSFDDRVTLEGEDGYSKTLGLVSQGRMHAHARGMTTVIFDGVRAGARYTCTIDPGREGPPYRLFTDLEVRPEHLLPREGRGGPVAAP